jgi:7-cyano-7-deazaguanine synthase in queuosine biosynthesis
MKKRTLKRKLVLNREWLGLLESKQLVDAAGAVRETLYRTCTCYDSGCDTCNPAVCG